MHLICLNNHTNTHLPSAFTYLNNRYQTQNSKFWRVNTKYTKSFWYSKFEIYQFINFAALLAICIWPSDGVTASLFYMWVFLSWLVKGLLLCQIKTKVKRRRKKTRVKSWLLTRNLTTMCWDKKKVSRTISSQVRKSGKNVELACLQEFYSEQISFGHYGHGGQLWSVCIKCVFWIF